MKTMIVAGRLLLVLTLVTGLAYPLLVTAVSQFCWPAKAGGSLEHRQGQVIGSTLIAQSFTSERYFWPRPSASSYGAVPSGASNLGPTNAALRQTLTERATALRQAHGLPAEAAVPRDLLHASGSGLDPHLSPAAAQWQVARVAQARQLAPERVASLVAELTTPPQWGVFGEPCVNVLALNLALDKVH